MEAKEQVLQAMREIGAPVNAGKIAEVTGLDRKVVDKAFEALKKEARRHPFAQPTIGGTSIQRSCRGGRPFGRHSSPGVSSDAMGGGYAYQKTIVKGF